MCPVWHKKDNQGKECILYSIRIITKGRNVSARAKRCCFDSRDTCVTGFQGNKIFEITPTSDKEKRSFRCDENVGTKNYTQWTRRGEEIPTWCIAVWVSTIQQIHIRRRGHSGMIKTWASKLDLQCTDRRGCEDVKYSTMLSRLTLVHLSYQYPNPFSWPGISYLVKNMRGSEILCAHVSSSFLSSLSQSL